MNAPVALPVTVPADELRRFTRDVFERLGLSAPDAEVQADVLLWANLRGIDSHGVLRVSEYVQASDRGWLNPRAAMRVVTETPAVLVLEGDGAAGPVAAVEGMRRAIAKARAVGIGWAQVRNTTHQGPLGYYAVMAAREGLAGIAIVCSPPNMAPYGARAIGVHNSPIAIAVPAAGRPPLVLDMATSVAAGGKLRLAVDRGVPLPPGWALAADGSPTTDARQAAILLPAGAYKGSGLAMMFECLASLMVGNPLASPLLSGREPERRGRQNGIVAALDIATFTDVAAFRRDVDELVGEVKRLPCAEGIEEVLVPGEPEDRTLATRARDGIPLPPGTVEKLRGVAVRFGVALPAVLAR